MSNNENEEEGFDAGLGNSNEESNNEGPPGLLGFAGVPVGKVKGGPNSPGFVGLLSGAPPAKPAEPAKPAGRSRGSGSKPTAPLQVGAPGAGAGAGAGPKGGKNSPGFGPPGAAAYVPPNPIMVPPFSPVPLSPGGAGAGMFGSSGWGAGAGMFGLSGVGAGAAAGPAEEPVRMNEDKPGGNYYKNLARRESAFAAEQAAAARAAAAEAVARNRFYTRKNGRANEPPPWLKKLPKHIKNYLKKNPNSNPELFEILAEPKKQRPYGFDPSALIAAQEQEARSREGRARREVELAEANRREHTQRAQAVLQVRKDAEKHIETLEKTITTAGGGIDASNPRKFLADAKEAFEKAKAGFREWSEPLPAAPPIGDGGLRGLEERKLRALEAGVPKYNEAIDLTKRGFGTFKGPDGRTKVFDRSHPSVRDVFGAKPPADWDRWFYTARFIQERKVEHDRFRAERGRLEKNVSELKRIARLYEGRLGEDMQRLEEIEKTITELKKQLSGENRKAETVIHELDQLLKQKGIQWGLPQRNGSRSGTITARLDAWSKSPMVNVFVATSGSRRRGSGTVQSVPRSSVPSDWLRENPYGIHTSDVKRLQAAEEAAYTKANQLLRSVRKEEAKIKEIQDTIAPQKREIEKAKAALAEAKALLQAYPRND